MTSLRFGLENKVHSSKKRRVLDLNHMSCLYQLSLGKCMQLYCASIYCRMLCLCFCVCIRNYVWIYSTLDLEEIGLDDRIQLVKGILLNIVYMDAMDRFKDTIRSAGSRRWLTQLMARYVYVYFDFVLIFLNVCVCVYCMCILTGPNSKVSIDFTYVPVTFNLCVILSFHPCMYMCMYRNFFCDEKCGNNKNVVGI